MTGDWNDSLVDGQTATRVAEALLRATQGRTVTLRLPAPSTAGDAGQLGLTVPLFNDVELGPAVFRTTASNKTMLISALAVESGLFATGAASVEVLFQIAAGILVDGALYRIDSCLAMQAAGQPYCYAVKLIPPVE